MTKLDAWPIAQQHLQATLSALPDPEDETALEALWQPHALRFLNRWTAPGRFGCGMEVAMLMPGPEPMLEIHTLCTESGYGLASLTRAEAESLLAFLRGWLEPEG